MSKTRFWDRGTFSVLRFGLAFVMGFAFVLHAQALTKLDSLRLRELMRGDVTMQSEQNARAIGRDRNVTLEDILQGFPQESLRDTLEGDSLALRRKWIEDMRAVRDSLRWSIDSLQKTIPDTADSSTVLKPFGLEVFQLHDLAAFEPSPIGPVSLDYPLGPGDEILISIWGDRELSYSLIVDREGKVVIPDLGLTTVNGLTLGEFKKVLVRRLSKIYSTVRYGAKNATTFVDVSLGKLRTVRAYVFGTVVKPGGYNLTGNATVWNALCRAGGPTYKGSLRRLCVLRNGKKVMTVDGYAYLLGERNFSSDRLENGDVLYVPARESEVYLLGEVNRPAIFEMVAGETVGNLLKMGGGFAPGAFPRRVQVERWEDYRYRKVTDIAFDTEEGKGYLLQPGDSVFVFQAQGETQGYYTINGEVIWPGRYEWRQHLKLSEAVRLAGGLTAEAYQGRVDIIHLSDDSTQNFDTYNLKKVMLGEKDVELQNRDQIAIYSIWMLKEAEAVSIWGEVKAPGYYNLVKGMSIEDLLFMAGGFTEKAFRKRAEISRILPGSGEKENHTEIMSVDLVENFEYQEEFKSILLKNSDMVFIRMDPDWHVQKNATILGEVRFPGTYSIQGPEERVSDLVVRAGGIKCRTAYLPGAVFKRSKDNLGRIALDLKGIIVKKKRKRDIALEGGDTLIIPVRPKTVKVLGEVGLPSSVLFRKGASLSYYIENAGGLNETADAKRIKVVLANGRAFQYKRWGLNPAINAGSTVFVPVKEEKDPTRVLQIVSQAATAITGILAIVLAILKIAE